MSKTKDEESSEIEDQINDFLARGGEIEQVDTSVSKDGYPLNRKQRKARNYFKNTHHNMFTTKAKQKKK
tara:strand:+ start:580 stop:786 length:207 start_codon:yes stop_codon:yes gene_type:complete